MGCIQINLNFLRRVINNNLNNDLGIAFGQAIRSKFSFRYAAFRALHFYP
jgi:hypothetical protein